MCGSIAPVIKVDRQSADCTTSLDSLYTNSAAEHKECLKWLLCTKTTAHNAHHFSCPSYKQYPYDRLYTFVVYIYVFELWMTTMGHTPTRFVNFRLVRLCRSWINASWTLSCHLNYFYECRPTSPNTVELSHHKSSASCSTQYTALRLTSLPRIVAYTQSLLLRCRPAAWRMILLLLKNFSSAITLQ